MENENELFIKRCLIAVQEGTNPRDLGFFYTDDGDRVYGDTKYRKSLKGLSKPKILPVIDANKNNELLITQIFKRIFLIG